MDFVLSVKFLASSVQSLNTLKNQPEVTEQRKMLRNIVLPMWKSQFAIANSSTKS